MNLGDRIRKARENAGLTQTELAEAVGVRYQSVQQWEANATAPTRARMAKLAAALGVSVSYIEFGVSAVAEEPRAHSMTDEAREIAVAWDALHPAKRKLYRDAILHDSAVAVVFPELGNHVAASTSYHAMIERIRKSRAQLERQLELKFEAKK